MAPAFIIQKICPLLSAFVCSMIRTVNSDYFLCGISWLAIVLCTQYAFCEVGNWICKPCLGELALRPCRGSVVAILHLLWPGIGFFPGQVYAEFLLHEVALSSSTSILPFHYHFTNAPYWPSSEHYPYQKDKRTKLGIFKHISGFLTSGSIEQKSTWTLFFKL